MCWSSHGLALQKRKWEKKILVASRAKRNENRIEQNKTVIEDERENKNKKKKQQQWFTTWRSFFPSLSCFVVSFPPVEPLVLSYSLLLLFYLSTLIRLLLLELFDFEKNQWLFIDVISQCVDTFIILVLIVSVCFAFSCSQYTYSIHTRMYKNTVSTLKLFAKSDLPCKGEREGEGENVKEQKTVQNAFHMCCTLCIVRLLSIGHRMSYEHGISILFAISSSFFLLTALISHCWWFSSAVLSVFKEILK